jgi:hypothetical protein
MTVVTHESRCGWQEQEKDSVTRRAVCDADQANCCLVQADRCTAASTPLLEPSPPASD